VAVGQFKAPISLEGLWSSARLLFPDRSPVVKKYADFRDIGLRVVKKFKYFSFNAAVLNGAGQNSLSTSSNKNLALRVEVYPIEGLTIGGATFNTVGIFSDNTIPWRDRYNASIRFERWGFLVQGEYIYARDRAAGSNTSFTGTGFYTALGYTLLKKYQFVFEGGDLNPDSNGVLIPTDKGYQPYTWYLQGGFNWYIWKDEVKLQASYARYSYNDKKPTDNQVIVAAQVAY